MLSESLNLKGEVITFVGPLNMSGFEQVNENEIDFLADLACDAGATISDEISDLTTIVVTSELAQEGFTEKCKANTKILTEDQFLDQYLTEVLTGAEWE